MAQEFDPIDPVDWNFETDFDADSVGVGGAGEADDADAEVVNDMLNRDSADGTADSEPEYSDSLGEAEGNPDDSHGSPVTFNAADRIIAAHDHEVYMREINQTGFRWQFDGTPDRQEFHDFISRHAEVALGDIDGYVDRIREFGGFVYDMEQFQGRPVIESGDYDVPPVTREVEPEEVAAYTALHNAVVDYTGVLLEHGPDSPEVREAAIAAAKTLHPEAWAGNGYDASIASRGAARWYLQAVIAQTTE